MIYHQDQGILQVIKEWLYLILIYSIIINSFTWKTWNDRSLAWLIYLESFALADGLPLWILAVYLFKEKAFITYLIIRILDIPAIVTVIYDKYNYLFIYSITLRSLFTTVSITLYIVTAYFIVRHYKET